VDRVVVAHESDVIRTVALRVVREAGYEGIGVGDGESARAVVFGAPPAAALVVDVGLPLVLGYELCDELRARRAPTRVILLASVYSKTAYKRRPSSLYGADDYLEQHHIPDLLGPKLARLVPLGAAATAPELAFRADDATHPALRAGAQPTPLSPAEQSEMDGIRDASEGRLAFRSGSQWEAVERARRLARLIMADALLYNGAIVEEGIRQGDLELRIAKDLASVRELFALRVPPETAGLEDFVGDALREFVAHRKGS
jgi:CheY-like chemotaxis protein